MKIEVKKFEIKINFDLKEKGRGEFQFDLEGYESQLDQEEFNEYINMIKTLIEKILKENSCLI